ncbi:flavin reductase family protein [Gordonia sp. CPCC 205515]
MSAFRGHPGGVAVVTADAGSGPVAMTVTSVSSTSVDPPVMMFSVSDQSSSAPTLRAAQTVVVHLLDDTDLDVAKLAATSGIDRFADTSLWSRLPGGEPYFHRTRTWIRGAVTARAQAGAATVLVVRALDMSSAPSGVVDDRRPLVYHARSWHALTESSCIE